MTLIILGLALWILAHALKPAMPAQRAALAASLGEGPAKGVVAAAIGLGLLLMVIGHRGAGFMPVWTPPSWTIHLNNLMMLGAVALMGMGRSRGRARSWLRHPMLTGVIVWAVAHLLVNGDLASLVLFGGLGLWAAGSIAAINARDLVWIRPEPGSTSGDLRLGIITLVIFGVIAAIHTWLGYWPFPQ
jgi:uncharacterized membrane protein